MKSGKLGITLKLIPILMAGAICVSQGICSMPPAGATATQHVNYKAAAKLAGPITKGHIIEPESALSFNLAKYGYVEHEYFASGTATSFKATSAPSDGRWTIAPTSTAFYRTRILVRRPTNPAHFNGTVVVEWLNVSAGESSPDWDYLNPELLGAMPTWVSRLRRSVSTGGRRSSARSRRALAVA